MIILGFEYLRIEDLMEFRNLIWEVISVLSVLAGPKEHNFYMVYFCYGYKNEYSTVL